MSRLIVAFESEVTRQRVCELFAASSFPVRASCRTGAEVLRAVHFMGGGVVVCGVKLADCTADQLYDDLDGLACMLVVAKPNQLEMCENPRIFRLPLPVNQHDLTASVRMLGAAFRNGNGPSQAERRRSGADPSGENLFAGSQADDGGRSPPLSAEAEHDHPPENGGGGCGDH